MTFLQEFFFLAVFWVWLTNPLRFHPLVEKKSLCKLGHRIERIACRKGNLHLLVCTEPGAGRSSEEGGGIKQHPFLSLIWMVRRRDQPRHKQSAASCQCEESCPAVGSSRSTPSRSGECLLLHMSSRRLMTCHGTMCPGKTSRPLICMSQALGLRYLFLLAANTTLSWDLQLIV